MVNCAAFGCKSHSQKKVLGITFHRFPRDPRKKALWIKNINNPDWSPTIYDRICSLHFERRFFYETDLRKRLLGEAVPTIFPDRSGYLQSKKKRMTKNLGIKLSKLTMKLLKNLCRSQVFI
ncbi:hypothetical protein HHI36_013757 [Cryptolaemus montrouzieri]|uniref:THAP-type domain-containing protein n=1 Tax=Cryptolaemus montrouzieri TaxID=559131 RepID=A0ABD2NIA8_9CUCU